MRTRDTHSQPSITQQFGRIKPTVFGRCIGTPASLRDSRVSAGGGTPRRAELDGANLLLALWARPRHPDYESIKSAPNRAFRG